MKKIIKNITICFAILCILFSSCSFATTDFKKQIKEEKGSLFENIIAECIGGLAQTVFDFTAGEKANVGFKTYEELIFNKFKADKKKDKSEESTITAISPFTQEMWQKTMNWYRVFAIISGSLILVGVFVLAYKIIYAGMNTIAKNEAKDSLMRLCFGGVAIALAPLFIKFLLFLNNSLVYLLVKANNSSLGNTLGENMITSIKTGNAIGTAIVIAMFIYLFVKLNIKFIIRQFTLIIFTIFTPIACTLWIINRNVTAASIWIGQIVINIFMQFIYCFLFLVYIAFLPSGSGWAVSLIWAMMILPLADALQNCFQNLTSRIAGIDNEQMAGRAMGIGAMFGYGLGAVKEQFKSANSNQSGDTNQGGESGLRGIVNRAKSMINPQMKLSDEKDYNGNINPIRNVLDKNKDKTINLPKKEKDNSQEISNGKLSKLDVAKSIGKTGIKASKAYMQVGKAMAEGDFSNFNRNKSYKKIEKNLQNTEYINSTKAGDDNVNNN